MESAHGIHVENDNAFVAVLYIPDGHVTHVLLSNEEYFPAPQEYIGGVSVGSGSAVSGITVSITGGEISCTPIPELASWALMFSLVTDDATDCAASSGTNAIVSTSILVTRRRRRTCISIISPIDTSDIETDRAFATPCK